MRFNYTAVWRHILRRNVKISLITQYLQQKNATLNSPCIWIAVDLVPPDKCWTEFLMFNIQQLRTFKVRLCDLTTKSTIESQFIPIGNIRSSKSIMRFSNIFSMTNVGIINVLFMSTFPFFIADMLKMWRALYSGEDLRAERLRDLKGHLRLFRNASEAPENQAKKEQWKMFNQLALSTQQVKLFLKGGKQV